MNQYKRVLLISLLFCGVSYYSSAQSYSQFIHKNPGRQVSFLEQFFRTMWNRDPFDGSYAMIIGVGDYDNLPRLDSPSQDADKMKTFLLNTAEYDEVVVLKDADARFETIRYFMQEYFPIKMDRGQHRFLFYFTGHGTQHIGYNKTLGYLQLKEATNALSSQVINMDDIEIWANQLPNAKHMLFLIDCCFSGLAGIESKGEYDTSVNPIELAREFGRFMITAGGADEKAIASLKEWGGSLFTQVAVRGMTGEADTNHDSIVTTYELFEYIQSVVKNEANARGRKQTPALRNLGTGTEKGQYFFIYRDVNRQPISPLPDTGVENLGDSVLDQETFAIDRILMTDSYGNVIEPRDDVYTITRGQLVRITVDIRGGAYRDIGVLWSAGHGRLHATDEQTNTYTSQRVGGDYLILEVWDKESGDELPAYPINITVVP